MIPLVLLGAAGRMGRAIAQAASTRPEFAIKALVDVAWATGVYTEANHFVLNKDVSGFETNPADMIELGQTTVG